MPPGKAKTIFILSSALWLKDQVGHILPRLLQLEEGLQTYGLLASIHQYSVVLGDCFCCFNSLIHSVDVQYSKSQVKQEAEADTHAFFCDFIHSANINGTLNFCNIDLFKLN